MRTNARIVVRHGEQQSTVRMTLMHGDRVLEVRGYAFKAEEWQYPVAEALGHADRLREGLRTIGVPEWGAWACPCGERDLSRRYGGPSDHDDAPDSPCSGCVERSFAEFG